MDLALQQTYYDLNNGFGSAQSLYSKLKPHYPKLTLKYTQAWVNSQFAQQVTSRSGRRVQYSSIIAPHPRAFYQMDLIIYDRFEMNHYKYILVVVDIYSRYALAKPLTNRTMPNLMKNIREIFDEMGTPGTIQCDNEFNRPTFKDYCKENNIVTRFSLPDEKNKNSLVERLNGTIAGIIQKWRQATGRYDWYKVLPDIMNNYNHRKHSTIKARPIDVWTGKDVNHQIPKKVNYKIKVGDRVRLAVQKGVFSKGDALTYSKNIYTVTKVNGIKVYLDNYADWLKPYQIQKVTGPVGEYEHPESEHEVEHNKVQRQRKLKRDLNKEGLVANEVALRRSDRERRPENLLEDTRYGKIKY
jgi:hypothetical protein